MATDQPFEKWLLSIKEEKVCGLASILQTNEAMTTYEPLRLFADAGGNIESTISDSLLEKQIATRLTEKLSERNPVSETIELQLNNEELFSVFFDIYTPPTSIMIFGAGHDAIPVAKYSISLGYPTTVVDARENFNNETNFPNTKRIIARPASYADKVQITDHTYIIIMNHHIEKDRETLTHALRSVAPYVGVLGPRSRRDRMIEQLRDEGIEFSNEQFDKMYNPVGLDIGAESSEEIAISILAEIITIRNGHQAGFLHGKNKIHKYSSTYEEENR